jgi:transcriptional regulator with XRE-family HTH domain
MASRVRSEFMRLRQAAGLTQQELAEILGVNRATVSLWENGRQVPQLTISQVKRLCSALGVQLDDLPDDFGRPVMRDPQR